jgi:GT2 family glycosyltransferase
MELRQSGWQREMDDVLVCIPWRDNGNKDRKEALNYVKARLEESTGLPANLVDGRGERFSLSAARNAGVDLAKEQGKSIVIVCDADTILDPAAIVPAVELARNSDSVVLPYTIVRYLTEYSTKKVLRRGLDPNQAVEIAWFDWSVGGAFVSRTDVWDDFGGQDERFTGWGCEDTAFYVVAQRMGRDHVRVTGTMNHLWHPSAPKENDPAYNFNAELLQRYEKTDNIEALIAEHKRGNQ